MFLPNDSDDVGDVVGTLFDLLSHAKTSLPKTREAALTLTKIEEALMWAQKIRGGGQ